MALQRMEHVGIVVEDLDSAIAFFTALGLEPQGETAVEGDWVDRIVGLEGLRVDTAMMGSPDGSSGLELIKFHSPPAQGEEQSGPANTLGLRHIAFLVEDIEAVVAGLEGHGAELVGEIENYENIYRLCYIRGPEGIIVELAEKIG